MVDGNDLMERSGRAPVIVVLVYFVSAARALEDVFGLSKADATAGRNDRSVFDCRSGCDRMSSKFSIRAEPDEERRQ